MSTFFKFPTTPHLFVLPGAEIRNDKILDNRDKRRFLDNILTAEEKIDGTNLGISFDDNWNLKIQNRGSYISPKDHPQFEPLSGWIYQRMTAFKDIIGTRYILFGEWCVAKHSIHYTSLPDWFLGFDLYDRNKNFFVDTSTRNHIMADLNVSHVPLIGKKNFTEKELSMIIEAYPSNYSSEHLEGIYLRIESGNQLIGRAKIVRPNFLQNITLHWKGQRLVKNQIIN
ncbi:MAG TPA: RNA ligase family protein [Puia sp.]|uniref:RNA ligase family protein n=1 Tax=Puia sp. TaxID=2045100 RepID=UPI002BC3DE7B|nr:RNA ligase family protein [Puia sp.]HVU93728.1 RNA ligase family protein [Puia sp.]